MKIRRTAVLSGAGAGLLFGAILAAGCITRGPESGKTREPMPPDYETRVSRYILKGWNFKLGKTIAEIKRNLGTPLSIIEQPVENIHDPDRTDTMYELRYQGLQVCVYTVTESSKEIVTDLTITSSRYPLIWGLAVGSPVGDVRAILGEPVDESRGILTYETGDAAPSSVNFFHRNGFVYKIGWVFYID